MVRSVDELPLPVDPLFGHFFDYLSEAVVMTGPADQILRVNRSFTEMFGYTPSEVSGSNIDVVLTSEGPLRDVARLLAGSVRDIDTVVRYGGDEFLIVLVETDGEKDFVRERILAEVERRKIGQDILGFPVTISIGGSYLNPGEGSRLDEVLAEADRQMYQEKTLKKEREIAKGDLLG